MKYLTLGTIMLGISYLMALAYKHNLIDTSFQVSTFVVFTSLIYGSWAIMKTINDSGKYLEHNT